jgi:hypothetical protein
MTFRGSAGIEHALTLVPQDGQKWTPLSNG